MNLIERCLDDTRTIAALKISKKRSTGSSTNDEKSIPAEEGKINTFKSKKAPSDQIDDHCDLV